MTQLAVIQTTSTADAGANLARAGADIAAARENGAEIVALPECFALMPRDTAQLRAAAEAHGRGAIQDFLAETARANAVWILAGSVPLRSPDAARIFNASLVYDAAGENVARYDKIHLFDAEVARADSHADSAADSAARETYRESAYTMPGGKCVVTPTPLGALGLSVCYDLRFPELYRKLTALGAVCLAVPSAFACATGAAHWRPLLRARAIENACYVIAAAQTGKHANGRRTYGHSMVVDPWGEVLAERAHGAGVFYAEIDAARVAEARRQLPCLRHRRGELFG